MYIYGRAVTQPDRDIVAVLNLQPLSTTNYRTQFSISLNGGTYSLPGGRLVAGGRGEGIHHLAVPGEGIHHPVVQEGGSLVADRTEEGCFLVGRLG